MTDTLREAIGDVYNSIENVLFMTDDNPIDNDPELVELREKLEDVFYYIQTRV